MLSRLLPSLALIAGLYPVAGFAAERPVVVELYTSQGCSSCPPANAYLNELSRNRRDVLPLAFHVTYWDRLGWKDPYSLQAATDRQDQYGHRFGDGSYTPEIVVDGATGLQVFRRITFPILRPILVILTSLSVIWDFQVFTQIYILRDNRPEPWYYLMSIFSFIESFKVHNFGLGAALSVITMLIMVSVSVFYIRQIVRIGDAK